MRNRMYRKRRTIVLMVAVLMVLVLNGGCGKKEQETEMQTEVVTTEAQTETIETEEVTTEKVTETIVTETETEETTKVESEATGTEEVAETFTDLETEEPVQVEKQAYELTYSGEFKDFITVKEVTEADESSLEFTVKLSETEATIFVMNYNTADGDMVTVLTDKEGTKIPVSFVMSTVPADLSEEDEKLFFSAQEEVNDIVASFKIK